MDLGFAFRISWSSGVYQSRSSYTRAVLSSRVSMASTQQAQLPQTAQVREMEEYINNSDFQQVHQC